MNLPLFDFVYWLIFNNQTTKKIGKIKELLIKNDDPNAPLGKCMTDDEYNSYNKYLNKSERADTNV